MVKTTNLPEDYEKLPPKKKYPSGRKSSGLTRKEYQKKWRSENKEAIKAYGKIYSRRYFRENPEKYLYWQTKNRARKKGLPFDLTPDDFKFPEFCPVLGIPMQRNIGGKSKFQNSPSTDRIIPEKGYVKDNVQIISMRANTMKQDASIEELQRFAQWVLKTFPLS